MSGRAGRRGKDDKGIVLQVLDEKMEPAVAKGILYGEADRLDSSYHVTYNMLLNLLRVEGADPDTPSAPSTSTSRRRRAGLGGRGGGAGGRGGAGEGGDAADAAATRRTSPRDAGSRRRGRRPRALGPAHRFPWLQPGRLATVVAPPTGRRPAPRRRRWASASSSPAEAERGRSVRVGRRRRRLSRLARRRGPAPAHVVDVLVADDDGGAKLACVPLVALAALSAVRVFMPPDLRRPEARARVRRAVDEVARRFAERREAVPELDDARDLGLDGKEAAYGEARGALRRLRTELAATPAGATVDASAAVREAIITVPSTRENSTGSARPSATASPLFWMTPRGWRRARVGGAARAAAARARRAGARAPRRARRCGRCFARWGHTREGVIALKGRAPASSTRPTSWSWASC